MKTLPTIVMILLTINICQFACKAKPEEAKDVTKLFNEVMDLHDEVMPKMSDLHYLKKEIIAIIDLEKLDSTELNNANAISKVLKHTDEDMMNWMADFKKPSKETQPEEAIAYLNGEKVKMDSIKLATDEIIKKAETWIEEHKN
jgi:hypothetical protein